MKNKWLIQSSGFDSHYLQCTADALISLKYDFSDFGLIHNNNTIINIENCLEDDLNIKYTIRGGTKLLRLLDSDLDTSNMTDYQIEHIDVYKQKLRDAIDYDVNKFDLSYYSKLDIPILNYDSEHINFEECKTMVFNTDMFIKPSRDLKAFNGGILKQGTSINDFVQYSAHQSFYKDEVVVISNIKQIYAEYRFFIIETKIITGSLYRRNSETIYDSFIPEDVMCLAEVYAKLYSPADIYVMDLAVTKNGIFVVEYNCWNASGLYACNIQRLFNSVQEFRSKAS